MIRCPGEGQCDIWDSAAGDFKQKSLSCLDCQQCQGNPPLQPGDESEDVEESFLRRIEYLYYEQLAGRDITPAKLTEDEWTGFVAWHQAEKQFQRAATANLNSLVQALRQQQQRNARS